MIRKFTLLVIAAGMASPAIAAPAGGLDADSRHQTVIRYADLDLASDAGVVAMQHRVRTAVRAVCPSYFGTTELRVRMTERQCVSETALRTNQRVDQLVANAKAARLASSYRVAVR